MGHFSTVNHRQGQHHQSVRKTADYRTRKTARDQRKTFNLHLSSLFKHSDLHEDTCCLHILCSVTEPSPAFVLLSIACERAAPCGPVSFITGYGRHAGLITVCAGEAQAQCDAAAAQRPTGPITGPDGFPLS